MKRYRQIMKAKTLFLFLAVGVFSNSPKGNATEQQSIDCAAALYRHTELTPLQAQSLWRAALASRKQRVSDLEYKVLTGPIDGTPRTVVLLGEMHIARHSDMETARTLFTPFDTIAVEGGLQSWAMIPASALMVPEYLLHSIRRLNTSSPIRAVNDELSNKRFIKLEEGYRMNLRENIELLGLALLSALKMSCVGACVVSTYGLLEDGSSPWLTLGEASAWAGAAALFGYVINPAVTADWLLVERDRSMTERIVHFFREHPSQRALLSIVGSAHLPGISQYLAEFGLIEQELEAEKQMPLGLEPKGMSEDR